MTTVDTDITASHEAAGIAEEVDRDSAVVLRLGQTTKHVLLGPLGAALGILDEQLLNHGGDNVARGDGVDSNAILTPLSSEVTGELENSSLGGVVRGADETLGRVGLVSASCHGGEILEASGGAASPEVRGCWREDPRCRNGRLFNTTQ